jgi:hypothetical protein
MTRENSPSTFVGFAMVATFIGFAHSADRRCNSSHSSVEGGRLGVTLLSAGTHTRSHTTSMPRVDCTHRTRRKFTDITLGAGEFESSRRNLTRALPSRQTLPLTWANGGDSGHSPDTVIRHVRPCRKKPGEAQPTLVPPSAIRRTALRKTSISSKVL